MYEALQELADIDVESMEDQELQNLLENEKLKLEGNWNRGLATQLLFEEKCEKQLIQQPSSLDILKKRVLCARSTVKIRI